VSGSGGNAFLDLLSALAPSWLPPWSLALASALFAIAAALVLLAVAGWISLRLELRLGAAARAAASSANLGGVLAWAGGLGALAAYPLAPHVFFADLDHGVLVMLALLGLAAAGRALDERPAFRAVASWNVAALALLVGVLVAGTPNLFAASRTQSAAGGVAWAAFENPFAAAACLVFVGALASDARGRGEGEPWLAADRAGALAWAALGATYFLGGFESPLTWFLRRSLGEDPGFLNHVLRADGSTRTEVALGGFAFQLVCAATLFAKALALLGVATWLGFARSRPLVARWLAARWATAACVACLCLGGAGLWEWARHSLGGGA
jgi:hypothetical protein